MPSQSRIVKSEKMIFPGIIFINETTSSRLFEELKIQFEVEKGQLLDERHNLNVQLNQHRERIKELESHTLELNGLLEKQKLCNE